MLLIEFKKLMSTNTIRRSKGEHTEGEFTVLYSVETGVRGGAAG